jgi:PAS domain S-box-containing protein
MSTDWTDTERLRDRLDRAEAFVAAIRGKEVDVVIGDDHLSYVRLREVEEELRRSQARYRAIVEDQSELICRWNPNGGITFANGAFCRFFRLDPAQALGASIFELMPDADRSALRKHALSGTPERPTTQRESRFQREGESPVFIVWTDRAILEDGGRLVELQSVGHDVTAERLAQMRMSRYNQELEDRAAARTRQLRELHREVMRAEQRERERIAGLVHDELQQTLAQARGILEEVAGLRPSPTVEAVVARAEGLVREAIESSRSLARELHPPILSMGTLAEAMEWLGDQMERHDLAVHVQAPPDLDLEDRDMKVLLFQTARELLFNAAKHSKAPWARLSLSTRNGTLELMVEDRGVGFDAEQALESGEGFGLLTIRERTTLTGGSLEVTSTPGVGTTVTVTLPIAPNV